MARTKKNTYEEIKCDRSGFKELFAYCEVMNYHFDTRPRVKGPVLFAELAHGMFAIYNSKTSTGYVLDGSKEWAEDQFDKCYAKYRSHGYDAGNHDASLAYELIEAYNECVRELKEHDI